MILAKLPRPGGRGCTYEEAKEYGLRSRINHAPRILIPFLIHAKNDGGR